MRQKKAFPKLFLLIGLGTSLCIPLPAQTEITDLESAKSQIKLLGVMRDRMHARMKSMEVEAAQLKQQNQTLQSQITRLQQQPASTAVSATALKNMQNQLAQERALSAQYKQAAGSLNTVRQQLEAAKASEQKLKTDLQAVQASAAENGKQLTALKEQNTSLQTERDEAMKKRGSFWGWLGPLFMISTGVLGFLLTRKR